MSNSSEFIQKFKAHIWDVCASKNIFHAMQENNLPLIKQLFENVIQNYQVQIMQDNEDKTQLIDHIVQEIHNQVQNIGMISNEEIKQQKKDKFEQDLQMKQNEFNEMMKKELPKEVDFGSIQDEPLGNENLELMLKEQMKQRENIEFNNPNYNQKNVPIINNSEQSQQQPQQQPHINNIMEIEEQNIIVQDTPMISYNANIIPEPKNDEIKNILLKIMKKQENQNILLEKLINSQIHILKQMK